MVKSKKRKRTPVSQMTARQLKAARRKHKSRSKRARRIDESRSGKIPKYVETWFRNPSKYDLPNVDTTDVWAREVERRRKISKAMKKKKSRGRRRKKK